MFLAEFIGKLMFLFVHTDKLVLLTHQLPHSLVVLLLLQFPSDPDETRVYGPLLHLPWLHDPHLHGYQSTTGLKARFGLGGSW